MKTGKNLYKIHRFTTEKYFKNIYTLYMDYELCDYVEIFNGELEFKLNNKI